MDGPEVVEASAEKLAELQRLTAEVAELERRIAAKAPARPRPWHTQARPEQLPPAGDWDIWLYLAGRGCVAGDSLVYLPEEDRHERIDVLAAARLSVSVLSLAPDGPVVARSAGAPFLKGWAPLFEVVCDDGSRITVTDQHRFLAPQGWLRLADVRVGQRLAGGAPAPFERHRVPVAVGSSSGPAVAPALEPTVLAAADDIEWTVVRSIVPKGTGPFFDLHVPGWNNYAAHGLWHHNSGKTKSGAEWIIEQAARTPDSEWAVIAPTWRDCQKVCFEGSSGLIKAMLPGEYDSMNLSALQLRLTNGSRIYGYSADRPDRLRGANLSGAWCVAKGTPVVTARGEVPIELVRESDWVATRRGWRRVSAARRTGVGRATVAVTTTVGVLRCTPDHRIAISEHEWRMAGNVNPGDILIGWMTPSQDRPRGSNSMGTGTTATPELGTTTTRPGTFSTARSGLRYMAGFLRGTRFTTAITTALTTAWRTWNSSPRKNTRNTTPLSSGTQHYLHDLAPSAVRNSSLESQPRTSGAAQLSAAARSPYGRVANTAWMATAPGMPATWSASSAASPSLRSRPTRPSVPISAARTADGPATPGMPATSPAATGSRSSRLAPHAETSSMPPARARFTAATSAGALETASGTAPTGLIVRRPSSPAGSAVTSSRLGPRSPSSAASSAGPVPVVLSVAPSLDSDVYDLTVEDAHEYYAGGVLVHNCDELATMQHAEDLLGEALMPALRIGEHPRVLITTTPRPVKVIKELVGRTDGSVVVVRGSTWDNAANLSATALASLRARYEGTRMGRQELEAEILEDVEGALWSRELLDASRVDAAPHMVRIVVGVDPAVTSGEKSDYTGIVVAGKSADGDLYILEDLSLKASPHACMVRAVDAYHRWSADRIVGEVNNGGDYLESLLRTVDPNVAYKTVRATRGKTVRAEPVASLWEQGRGHIVGVMPELEDQMCSFTLDGSTGEHDDRVDAAVWTALELQVGASAMVYLAAISRVCNRCEMPNRRTDAACRGCGEQLPAVA